jgi:Trypsin-co-occurring domain 2
MIGRVIAIRSEFPLAPLPTIGSARPVLVIVASKVWEGLVDKIGLPETIEAVRAELRNAIAQAEGQELQFPVGGVQLEFQVGITREASGEGRLKVWVLELGAGVSYARESLQKVTITLDAPVDADGKSVRVIRRSHNKP